MDDHRPPYDLKAPGGSGHSQRLPGGRRSFPPLDEHLVTPEVTRDEIIGGRRVVAQPAQEPHATRQFTLDYVLAPHIAPGYTGAADLITRVDAESNFASDACVYKSEIDPQTGTRHLEELVFEVVSEQDAGDVTEKALRMQRRGVRRIFAIFVKGEPRVCEWSSESRSWRRLELSSSIEDPCLKVPLKVAALLDAAAANQAVVEALAAQGDPTLRSREAAARSEGEAWGIARGEAIGRSKTILQFLEARGIAVSPSQREEILRCEDLDRLDRWTRLAALASSAEDILAD
jgi:Putative restriction endonuclease